jgi:hypothetical protein
MNRLLATAMLLTCTFAQASTGYFLVEDKKAGIRINQELLPFADYEVTALFNRYNFINTQSLNFYFPNETIVGFSFSLDSKLKKDEVNYKCYLSLSTKLW